MGGKRCEGNPNELEKENRYGLLEKESGINIPMKKKTAAEIM